LTGNIASHSVCSFESKILRRKIAKFARVSNYCGNIIQE
jgi:hypothetical protein